MDDAVADGVRERRIREVVVPVGRCELARDDRRPCSVPVLEKLEEMTSFLVTDGRDREVIDDEDVDAREPGEHADVAAVGVRDAKLIEDGTLRLLLGTDAASEGLNLQRLGTLIHIDLPWNPTRLEQRKGRIQRIGQRAGLRRVRARARLCVRNAALRDGPEPVCLSLEFPQVACDQRMRREAARSVRALGFDREHPERIENLETSALALQGHLRPRACVHG